MCVQGVSQFAESWCVLKKIKNTVGMIHTLLFFFHCHQKQNHVVKSFSTLVLQQLQWNEQINILHIFCLYALLCTYGGLCPPQTPLS